jgi:hypothetical protein
MIGSKDFDRVSYSFPRPDDKRPTLSRIVGIDSEAFTTGEPFILGTSYGDILRPRDVPCCFFTDKYLSSNFVVWNLKYDSGAVLYFLPREILYSLWSEGKATLRGSDGFLYRFHYVPHKMLRINRGRLFVVFWDISQFFKTSLDRAAMTYLGERKIVMRTKNFTPKYYFRFINSIHRYCIRDAMLTARLGEYLVAKFGEFGITASTLYSPASISFRFFSRRSKIVHVWRYWEDERRVLELSSDAYEGGKFEVTARGPFHGMEYDITSAYPFEIANLVDISNARVVYTTEYQPRAVYGFLDCTITNYTEKHLPCGPMPRGVRIYPMGIYRLVITKNEYDYLMEIGVPVQVHEACWLFVKRKKYPYRKTVDYLFSIKSKMKKTDRMLYQITKVCLNGFYGKMAQSIVQPDGKIVVGQGWNPVYASVITANTRIKITRIQNLMREDCLAVHTDSAIVTRPLPDNIDTDGQLGNFERVIEGDGLLVACGMYQLGEECRFKGFRARRGETWRTILERFPDRKTVPYRVLHVESWIESMAKNHTTDHINVFQRSRKLMSLNCDVKRLWFRKVRARDLLSNFERSAPKVHIENT